jgi:hypothetical protein
MEPLTNVNPIISTECLAGLSRNSDPQSEMRVIEIDVSPTA